MPQQDKAPEPLPADIQTNDQLRDRRCEKCKHWVPWTFRFTGIEGNCGELTRDSSDSARLRVYSDSDPITTEKDFSCIHFST